MKNKLSGLIKIMLFIIMAFVMAISSLVGCNKGGEPEPEPNPVPETEQTEEASEDYDAFVREASPVVNAINKLPEMQSLTYNNYGDYLVSINKALVEYNKLSNNAKLYVTNYTKLLNLLSFNGKYKVYMEIKELPDDISQINENNYSANIDSWNNILSEVKSLLNKLTDQELEEFRIGADSYESYNKYFKIDARVSALTLKFKIAEIQISTVSLKDEEKINELRKEYNALIDYSIVNNYEILINAENKIQALKVEELVKTISSANQITSLTEVVKIAAVNNADKAFNKLSPSQKIYLSQSTVDKLSAVLSKINDLEQVKVFVDKVDAIGDVTLNPTKISDAYSAYENLNQAQKDLVPESALTTLESKREEFNAKTTIAKDVYDKIEALKSIDQISLSDANSVEEARSAYDLLDSAYVGMISNYSKLVLIENRLTNLETIKVVKDLVDDFGKEVYEVETSDEVTIFNIQKEYNLLNADQKALLGAYETKIIGYIGMLGDKLPTDISNKIETLISDIDGLTKSNKEEVQKARNDYNTLDKNYRQYVSNIDKLILIEDQIGAEDVIVLIDAIPDTNILTSSQVGYVNDAKSAYNALSERGKSFVTNYSKLLICQEILGNFAFRGKINYVIVVSDDASSYELRAVETLNNFFNTIYGYKIDVVSDKTVNITENSQYLVIGRSELFNDAGIEISDEIGGTGFILKTVDSNIFIASATGRGTGVISGVYRFLKEYFNYEAYAIDEVVYDNDDTVLFKSLEDIPPVIPDIVALNQTGDNRNAKTQMAMAGISDNGDVFATGQPYHNVFTYVDPGQYSSVHPYWYSSDKTQLCYTAHGDADELEALVETIYTKLKAQYDTAKANGIEDIILTVTNQDNGTFCDCPECHKYNTLEWYNASTSNSQRANLNYSLTNVLFMNKLSDRFARAGITDVSLMFFVYLQTETAPKTGLKITDKDLGLNDTEITMRANLIPMIAPIYPVYSREESFEDNGIKTLIEQWLALSEAGADKARFALWSYSANYQNYLAPYDPFTCLTDNFKLMKEYSDKGQLILWKDEGAGDGDVIGSGFTYFRYWLQGKMALNASYIDTDEKFNNAIDEFFNAYYKEGAPFMKQYFNSYISLLREKHGTQKNNGYTFYGYTFDDFPNFYDVYTYQVRNEGKGIEPWFTKAELENWKNMLESAKSATEGTIAHSRVLLESVMVDYFYLKLYGIDLVNTTTHNLTALNNAKAQWYADLNECGISMARESEDIESAFATKLGSSRLSATISDLQVLAQEAYNIDESTSLKDIYDLCDNFERLYNNDIYSSSNKNKWSQDDKNTIESAYTLYNGAVSKQLYNRIKTYIDTLPNDTADINMFNGSAIEILKTMYARLNDTYKNKLANDETTRYNKYVASVEFYSDRWGVGYNELDTWVNDASIGSKANVGCDSYRSVSESELVTDETFGTVTEVKVLNAKLSTQATAVNFSALFSNYSSLVKVVKDNPDIAFVKFWVKMNSDYIEISTGMRSFTKFPLEEGKWTEIQLTREQFINGQGAVRRERYHNKSIYFTNFYFVTTTSLAENVVNEVALFPAQASLLTINDSNIIDKAINDYQIVVDLLGDLGAKNKIGAEVYEKLMEYSEYYSARWIPVYNYNESIPFTNKVDDTWGVQITIGKAEDDTCGTVVVTNVKYPSNGNTQYNFDMQYIKDLIAANSTKTIAGLKFYAYYSGSDTTFPLRFDIGGGWQTANLKQMKNAQWTEIYIPLDELNMLTGKFYTMYSARSIMLSNFYLITDLGSSDALVSKIDDIYDRINSSNYIELLSELNEISNEFDNFEFRDKVSNANKLSEIKVNLVSWYVNDLTPVDEMTLENIVDLMFGANTVKNAINNLTATEQTNIPSATTSAYNAYVAKIEELKSGYINELIDKIELFTSNSIENGKTIYDAMKWYNTLEDKSGIEPADVIILESALATFNESWYLASDVFEESIFYPIIFPTDFGEGKPYSDSYRAKATITLASDDTYSDVTKVTVVKNTTGNCDNNMQFRFDVDTLKAQFNGKDNAVAITFLVKSTSASTIYVSTSNVPATMYSSKKVIEITEADVWTPIVLTKEELETSSGVIFRDGYAGENPIDIYITNFYLVTANEYVKPLIAKINGIAATEKANYLEKVDTVKAIREEYNLLTDVSKACVLNYSQLEATEINIAGWFIEDMTAANDMVIANYMSLISEVNTVTEYYNSLSDSQKSAISSALKKKYNDSVAKLSSIKVDYVVYLINELNGQSSIEAKDYATIEYIENTFATLSADEQSKVTNYQTFTEDVVSFYELRYIPAYDYANSIPLKNTVDGTFGTAVSIATEFDDEMGTVLVSKVTNESNFNTKYQLDISSIKDAMEKDNAILGVKFYAYYSSDSDATWALRFDIGDGYSTAKLLNMKNAQWTEFYIDKATFSQLTGTIYTMYAARGIKLSNFYMVKAQSVADQIEKDINTLIENYGSMTGSDATALIVKINEDYANLGDYNYLVDSAVYSNFTAKEDEHYTLLASSVINSISELAVKAEGMMQPEDYALILSAKASYDNLPSEDAKNRVTNLSDLDAVQQKFEEIYSVLVMYDMTTTASFKKEDFGGAGRQVLSVTVDEKFGNVLKVSIPADYNSQHAPQSYVNFPDITGYDYVVTYVYNGGTVNKTVNIAYAGCPVEVSAIAGQWTKIVVPAKQVTSAGRLLVYSAENGAYYLFSQIYAVKTTEVGTAKLLEIDIESLKAEVGDDGITTSNFSTYSDKVNELYAKYETLTDKTTVSNREILEGYIESISTVKAQFVDDIVSALMDKGADNLEASDYILILRAKSIYDKLSNAEQAYVQGKADLDTLEQTFNNLFTVVMLEDATKALDNDSVGAPSQYHHYDPAFTYEHGQVIAMRNEDKGNMRAKITVSDLEGYTIYVSMLARDYGVSMYGVNMYWAYNGGEGTSPAIKVGEWVTKTFEGVASGYLCVGINPAVIKDDAGNNVATGDKTYIYYMAPVYAVKLADAGIVRELNNNSEYELPLASDITTANYSTHVDKVEKVYALFNSLSEDNKLLVEDKDNIIACFTAVSNLKVQVVEEAIDSVLAINAGKYIPTDYNLLKGAQNVYDALLDSQKQLVDSNKVQKLADAIELFNKMYDVIVVNDMSGKITNATNVAGEAKDYHHFDNVDLMGVAGYYGKAIKIWNKDTGNIAGEFSYNVDLTGYTIYINGYSNENSRSYLLGPATTQGTIKVGEWSYTTIAGLDGSETEISFVAGVNMSGTYNGHETTNFYYFAPIIAVKKTAEFDAYRANALIDALPDIADITANNYEEYSAVIDEVGVLYDTWVAESNTALLDIFDDETYSLYVAKIGEFALGGFVDAIDKIDTMLFTADAYAYIYGLKTVFDAMSGSYRAQITNAEKLTNAISKFEEMYDVVIVNDMSTQLTKSKAYDGGADPHHHFDKVSSTVTESIQGYYGNFSKVTNGDTGNITAEMTYSQNLTGYKIFVMIYSNAKSTNFLFKHGGSQSTPGGIKAGQWGFTQLDGKDGSDTAVEFIFGINGTGTATSDNYYYIAPIYAVKVKDANINATLFVDAMAILGAKVNITLEDLSCVKFAKEKLSLLTDGEKTAITNLNELESALAGYEAELKAIVQNEIDAIVVEDVVLESESDISLIRTHYASLTDKSDMTITKLTDAENKIVALKAVPVLENVKPVAEITLEDEESVTTARNKYNSLTKAQKAFVDSEIVDKLLDAEEKIAAIKVENAIKALAGFADYENYVASLTKETEGYEDLKTAVVGASAAYNALISDYTGKKFFDANLKTVLDAYASKIDALENASVESANSTAVVQSITELNKTAETITLNDYKEFYAIEQAYEALILGEKAYVNDNSDYLALYNKIHNGNTIEVLDLTASSWVNGSRIASIKNESGALVITTGNSTRNEDEFYVLYEEFDGKESEYVGYTLYLSIKSSDESFVMIGASYDEHNVGEGYKIISQEFCEDDGYFDCSIYTENIKNATFTIDFAFVVKAGESGGQEEPGETDVMTPEKAEANPWIKAWSRYSIAAEQMGSDTYAAGSVDDGAVLSGETDVTYGTVLKLTMPLGTQGNTQHWAADFCGLETLKAMAKADGSIVGAEFYVYMSNRAYIEISTNGNSEYTRFNLTQGAWSKVYMTRDQILGTNGNVRADWACGDDAYIKVSELKTVAGSTELENIANVISKIEALNDNPKENDYLAIRTARIAYNSLTRIEKGFVTNYSKLVAVENAFNATYDVILINDMSTALTNDTDVAYEARSYHHFVSEQSEEFVYVNKIWNQDAGNMRALISTPDLTGYTIYITMMAHDYQVNMYWGYNGSNNTEPTLTVGNWVIKELDGGAEGTLSVGINTASGNGSYIYYIAPIYAIREKSDAKVNSLAKALPTADNLEMLDGENLYKAYNAYEALDTDAKSAYDAKVDSGEYVDIVALKTAYETKWVMVYGTSSAWVNGIDYRNFNEWDSFSAIATGTTTTDATYGTVTAVTVATGTSGRGEVDKNGAMQISMAELVAAFNANPTATAVKFYYKATPENWGLTGKTSGSKTTVIATGKTGGAWGEITLTRAQIINGSGEALSTGIIGDTNIADRDETFYFSNFYLVK